MYRFWDGTMWSPVVSSTPGPQGVAPGTQPMAAHQPSTGASPLLSRTPAANPYAGASGFTPYPGPTKPTASIWRSVGWLLAVFVVVGALVFGGLQLLRGFGVDPLNPTAPSNPTVNPCPTASMPAVSPASHPNDGRVHGGKLSYPQLGSPWSAPEVEQRLPFGVDATVQTVTVEPNYDGSHSWVASVLVAELVAGDGFFSPKEATELITKCSMSEFYSDAVVQRTDVSSKAVTVDGHDAWVIETHLAFDIPGLKVKGETAIFEVVKISDASSSVYYASIPDSVPELLTVARQVQDQLKVDP